jgi:hypothetical protein
LRPRLLVCATVAVLSVASAGLVGACSSGACSETLTCDDAATEGGEDGTVDSAIDVGADTTTDVTVDAPGETSVDGSDAGDAADGSSDARDSSADSGDAPSDALDASDARDAPADVVEAAAVCGAPFTCTPAVPAGFTGPVAFVQEAPASGDAPTPPSCAAPYGTQVVNGFNNPVASQPTCTCACGAVDGGCIAPQVETFTDNTCVNVCKAIPAAGTCAAPITAACGGATSSSAKVIQAAQPGGGSCTASVQTSLPTWNPTQDWGVTGRACSSTSALPEGGCVGTDLCAPPSPFGTSLCVWKTGNVGCPASYPNAHLTFASGADQRGCINTSCSCGSPSGVSCSATTTVEAEADSGCLGNLLVGTSCTGYTMTTTPFVSAIVTPSGGSCTAGGVASPTGGIVPMTPTTVCCAN